VSKALRRSFFLAAVVVASVGVPRASLAATATWIAPSNGDRSFNSPGNWSTGVVPGPNDDVVADGAVTTRRMDVDSSIDVKSFTTQNGYSGNINFNGGNSDTMRVRGNVTLNGTGNFDCATGGTTIDGNLSIATSVTVAGGGATINVNGNVTVAGGTFNGLTGTLTIGGSLTVSAGSFTGSSGLLIIGGSMNLMGGTFHTSSTTTRIGGAFNETGGTLDSNGSMVFTSKTNVTHTFGGGVFRRLTVNDGMVAYYNLDENTGTTVTDSSGFTNTGTSTNMTWGTTTGPGLFFANTSYGTFNGTSSRVALTVSQLPAANAAQSMSAWVKITALPGSASSIVALTGASSAMKLGLSSSQLRVLRNDGTALVSTSAPSTGTWHHVAYTWDGTTNTLYVDGVAVTSTTTHDSAAVTAAFVGATSAAADFFNGSIDEVRIYDRALTATDVSALALGQMPGAGIATHTFNDAYSAAIGTNIADLVIASGTVAGSSAISIEGSWLNYGGRFTGTGTVTLTSGGAESLLSGGSRFSALTINRSGANYTLKDRLWIPNGTFTLTTGRIQLSSYIMHVGAMALAAGTTFTTGTGTVVFDSLSNQTLPSSILTAYYGLRLEDPSEAGLVGYWKLDEASGASARDASGTGNAGTLSSTVKWTSGSGSVGFDNPAAASFDGASAYVTAGTTSLPATNAAQTISAWVNIASAPGTSSIVSMTGASSAVKLGLSASTLRVIRNDGTALISTTAPSTGAWHHVLYTWDGSANNLYVDGVAVAPTATAHDSGAVSGAFIGASSASADFFNGKIDDVRIYSTALTATQIAQLAAGRYAGAGGYATYTLGAATTVSAGFIIDAGNFSSGSFTFGVTAAAQPVFVNAGTYTVGSAAQSFSGGLTIQPMAALTMATSGGNVRLTAGTTLTMDGTLNASSAGASISNAGTGTYTFSVGSTATARPTLNISGLTVQNTDSSGMAINKNHSAVTTFTRFDGLVFLSGTTTYLNIYANALYLNSSSARFGITTGGVSDGTLPTNNVTLAGNGTADGETRVVFGTATCAAAKTTGGYCQDAWASDDDSDNNGLGDNPGTNGAVVQYVRSVSTDIAGNIEGLPTAAFDWNTFTYYSTYVAFHDTSGTADRIYVRDQTGTAKYSWDTPSGETMVGTPRWNTTGTGHYLYVALASGKVYRLIDNGSSLVLDTSAAWAVNPYSCGCTIVSPLALDTTNLYWGGTVGSTQQIFTLGQATKTGPPAVTITPTITSSAPALWTDGTSTFLFMGMVGNILKFNASTQMFDSTNTNPGSAAIYGRVVPSSYLGTVFAGDDGGTMWAINATTFSGTNKLWSYAVSGDSIKSSPYVDVSQTTAAGVYFGTEAGKVIGLANATGALLANYPVTPDGATDPIRTAPLYTGGLLIVGNTKGKLFFIDRSTGTLYRKFYFGPTEAVSSVGYDSTVSRYMVSTSDTSTNDGRLYYIDLIADPTAGTP
jgi:hypothetical protein